MLKSQFNINTFEKFSNVTTPLSGFVCMLVAFMIIMHYTLTTPSCSKDPFLFLPSIPNLDHHHTTSPLPPSPNSDNYHTTSFHPASYHSTQPTSTHHQAPITTHPPNHTISYQIRVFPQKITINPSHYIPLHPTIALHPIIPVLPLHDNLILHLTLTTTNPFTSTHPLLPSFHHTST